MTIRFVLNGEPVEMDARPDERFVDLLRDRLGLPGAKVGCGIGRCGSCTVIIDDVAMNGCLLPAYKLEGRRITTVEGLGSLPEGRAVILAFSEGNAFQCGYCAPGFTVAMTALLMREDVPDEADIREALGGHVCRCTGYHSILRAAADAAVRCQKDD
ncbi:2Fe-2S iron-sulfur cluster binding domain-containing protein [Parvibaculum sedimenti]|uniref:2Fe-2S iron-sulfur cluster binding domain-containing protein n=1 Tax=Parvibaculum sedimenti TaxID=2608632 RepID=A0A6N6VR69_9HYPH|nr:(2Fe-2S)-binding protein [Parvibaculum sedimenti]KAB7741736.1 2Fe-2S iron-sulfur cluster binding domain-containing protein [Parvibaculum sedimenti]